MFTLRLKRMAAAGAICLLLGGCGTTNTKIHLGDSPAEVKAAWGSPDQVSKSVSRGGVLEIWRYGEYWQHYVKKYWLTFYNGQLVEIAE